MARLRLGDPSSGDHEQDGWDDDEEVGVQKARSQAATMALGPSLLPGSRRGEEAEEAAAAVVVSSNPGGDDGGGRVGEGVVCRLVADLTRCTYDDLASAAGSSSGRYPNVAGGAALVIAKHLSW